jgi:hypothetical protein
VYFDGISLSRRTGLGHYAKGAPPIYMFPCSHVPMEIFLFYQMKKKRGNKKKKKLCKREVPLLMHFPKVRKHPWAHALECPY